MQTAATISAIEYYLPSGRLTNEMLAAQFPEWSVQKIEEKTGIASRPIAAPDECVSDMAVAAAQKLFNSKACLPEEIDFLLLCTQSPDYVLPTTACLVQDRLGIPTKCGALDFNLGCSGFVYGLGLAKGLIESGQARRVLLVTAEAYSKHIHPSDKSVRTLFGDAAAATLVIGHDNQGPAIGPFVYGTDGSGYPNLIVPAGGVRRPRSAETACAVMDASGNRRAADNIFMNGVEIFNFTLAAVPNAVHALLERTGQTLADVDLFIFHQANSYMLEHLRRKLNVPSEHFFVALKDYGNTVSSTIPIALRNAFAQGVLRPGALVMLVGFGVGYSWGATLVRWSEMFCRSSAECVGKTSP
jgi:3-oxoacyl-[acyl-carrier-protein] synthase-3